MCIRPLIFNPLGYLWEFAISLNAPHPAPLPVLRQGRHASWMPNSPLSGHRATAAVAAIIRVNYSLSWCCVHITRPRIHVRVCCLLLRIQRPLTKFTVCCFTFDQSWGVSGRSRIKVLRAVAAWLARPWSVWLTLVCLRVAPTPCVFSWMVDHWCFKKTAVFSQRFWKSAVHKTVGISLLPLHWF